MDGAECERRPVAAAVVTVGQEWVGERVTHAEPCDGLPQLLERLRVGVKVIHRPVDRRVGCTILRAVGDAPESNNRVGQSQCTYATGCRR